MKFSSKLAKLNFRLAAVSGGLIMIIGLLSVIEVILRNLFSSPTMWTMDISQFALIWAIFIGAGYAFQEHGHVRVDLFTEKLPPKARKVVAIIAYLLAAAFVTALGYSSVMMFMQAIRFERLTISMVQIPQWTLIISMIGGCVMMLITLAGIIIDLIGNGKKYL